MNVLPDRAGREEEGLLEPQQPGANQRNRDLRSLKPAKFVVVVVTFMVVIIMIVIVMMVVMVVMMVMAMMIVIMVMTMILGARRSRCGHGGPTLVRPRFVECGHWRHHLSIVGLSIVGLARGRQAHRPSDWPTPKGFGNSV